MNLITINFENYYNKLKKYQVNAFRLNYQLVSI